LSQVKGLEVASVEEMGNTDVPPMVSTLFWVPEDAHFVGLSITEDKPDDEEKEKEDDEEAFKEEDKEEVDE
jgi:hypothetical protein